MVDNTLPYLNVLLQDFEEKMNHVRTCLFHGDRILQTTEELEASELAEARVFVSTGYIDMQEIRDMYLALKKGKYQWYCKDTLPWHTVLTGFSKGN